MTDVFKRIKLLQKSLYYSKRCGETAT